MPDPHALLPVLAADASTGVATALFLGLSALAVGSALLAALAPSIVRAALGLLGTLLAVAGLYALAGADFLALAQVLVYVGGILVLLVFGVLLTGRVLPSLGLERRPGLLLPAACGGVVLLALLLAIAGTRWSAPRELAEPLPTTAALGRALLDPGRYLVPFELASVLLLAALVGAAYLVRRRRER